MKPSNPNAITQNFTTIFPAKLTSDQTVDRVDQNIGYKVRLFFRYQRQEQDIANGSAIPYNAAEIPSTTDNYTVGYTHTHHAEPGQRFPHRPAGASIRTRSTISMSTASPTPERSWASPASMPTARARIPGTPEFNVSGFSGWGNSGTNWFQTDRTWQASEQISWT